MVRAQLNTDERSTCWNCGKLGVRPEFFIISIGRAEETSASTPANVGLALKPSFTPVVNP